MIKAIIYTSNSGFTKEYAELLSKEVNIPVYELKKIKNEVAKNEEILYMGWIMGGMVIGLNKALKKYNIKAVCCVGMSKPNEKQNEDIIKQNNLNKDTFFYLQGGFDMEKLSGIYKFMMKSIKSNVEKSLQEKENKTEEDLQTLEMMRGRVDCVSKENLENIINFIKSNN